MTPEVVLLLAGLGVGAVAYFLRARDAKLDALEARTVVLEKEVALLTLRDQHHDATFAAILAKLDAIEALLRGRDSTHRE